jgi:tripartite-type tricarboxylate transporter receptor subunit TctC
MGRPLAAADAAAPRRSLLAGGAAAVVAPQAWAAAYPESPVVIVAPFSAGGAADIAARTLAAHAGRHLPNRNATLVVENRTGASGAIGSAYVARAKPDGLTLLLARVASAAILPAIDPRTPYAWDGFTMLGLLDENPYLIAVRADAPWKTLEALVAALRETPGRLTFATTGPATILDLGVRTLFVAAGLPLDAGLAVPFRGGGEAVAGLLAGEAEFIGNNLADTAAALAAGRLRALVVTTPHRIAALPGVPTAAEAGMAELGRISGWSALFGPPGLPALVVAAWTDALAELSRDRGWLAATQRVGSIPRLLPPAETLAFVRGQLEFYHDLGRRLGVF